MRLSARASGSSCGAGVVYPLEAPPTQPAMPARTQYRPICHAYQQLLAQVCFAEIVQIKRVLLLVDQPCAATVEKRTCGFPNSRWRLKSFQQSAATASRAKIYFVSARRLAAAVRARASPHSRSAAHATWRRWHLPFIIRNNVLLHAIHDVEDTFSFAPRAVFERLALVPLLLIHLQVSPFSLPS